MKSLSFNFRRVFLIVGVLFLTLVIVEFNSRLEEFDRLNRQVNIARAEATQAAVTQTALEAQIAYAQSDQIVEEQARSEGHMIQDGDHLVVIIGDEGENSITNPELTPTAPAKPNWMKWWDLYLSKE